MNPDNASGAKWMESRGKLAKAGVFLVAVLCAYFFIKTINEIKTGQTIGSDSPAVNTITVSGEGEVFAVPDIATFSFTVNESGKVSADAEKLATGKINKVIAYLKEQKIADKDIKTTDYSLNPKYEYSGGACTQYSCPPSRQILTGYEISQTVTVKVRDTAKAGDILSGVGKLNVQNISGLSLTIDDQKAVENQAREKAIAEARSQAQTLASQLGVRLVRITNFSESGNYPQPYYYGKAMAMDSAVSSQGAAAPAIPTGENKITSNVTITYEIR